MRILKKFWYYIGATVALIAILIIVSNPIKITNIISPLQNNRASSYEVFGFAPYWNLSKLDNVDFSTLTTLAYFGVPINGDGTLDTSNVGYEKLQSQDATDLFNKAHKFGTRVVLTVTMMDNSAIDSMLDNPQYQKEAIAETVKLVEDKHLDGINIDAEYVGDPGSKERGEFDEFAKELTNKMHSVNSNSKVTVSVYATAAKYPKLDNVGNLAKNTDGIFMMAYDFATTGANSAMPTAPLYGYKQGKYWYDISTAVADFLKVMPANKLILGLPWYGYDYPVTKPAVNASRNTITYWYKYWYSRYYYVWRQGSYTPASFVQTYTKGENQTATQSGWDSLGEVGWKAYQDGDGWRMYFLEDSKSLSIKYDFAKDKGLGGVGIWALGFDEGHNELWSLLSQKFGPQLARVNINE